MPTAPTVTEETSRDGIAQCIGIARDHAVTLTPGTPEYVAVCDLIDRLVERWMDAQAGPQHR